MYRRVLFSEEEMCQVVNVVSVSLCVREEKQDNENGFCLFVFLFLLLAFFYCVFHFGFILSICCQVAKGPCAKALV